jgi:hypothetical protein
MTRLASAVWVADLVADLVADSAADSFESYHMLNDSC